MKRTQNCRSKEHNRLNASSSHVSSASPFLRLSSLISAYSPLSTSSYFHLHFSPSLLFLSLRRALLKSASSPRGFRLLPPTGDLGFPCSHLQRSNTGHHPIRSRRPFSFLYVTVPQASRPRLDWTAFLRPIPLHIALGPRLVIPRRFKSRLCALGQPVPLSLLTVSPHPVHLPLASSRDTSPIHAGSIDRFALPTLAFSSFPSSPFYPLPFLFIYSPFLHPSIPLMPYFHARQREEPCACSLITSTTLPLGFPSSSLSTLPSPTS